MMRRNPHDRAADLSEIEAYLNSGRVMVCPTGAAAGTPDTLETDPFEPGKLPIRSDAPNRAPALENRAFSHATKAPIRRHNHAMKGRKPRIP